MSADQYRAIAECLSGKSEMAKRGRWFASMAETAEWNDWPSSATAPSLVLTAEEASAIWNGPFELRQRVSAPYLTETELAALELHAKETHKLGQEAFGVQGPGT